ncbi:TPA: alpha-2,3-N-acetylneuraminyltransferase [Streptococcus suis]|nr:alpha-2,3-N-acetylneuraminyltransferase [Streptococcus suis]
MRKENNKNIYICYTLYHILISLVYSLMLNERIKIVLTTRIENVEIFRENIHKNFPLVEVVVVDDEAFRKVGLFYSPQTHTLFKSQIGDGDIHIYNDFTQIGHYLHRNKISYTLMEDGLNCMQYPLRVQKMTMKDRLRNILTNTPKWDGYSQYCKKIVVNDLEGIRVDSRHSKFVEDSKKELFSQLSFCEKEKLLAVFEVQPIVIKESAVLILTQPLEEEFPDEVEKRDFWRNVIDKYRAEGFHIYVKVHPRDTLDYSSFPVTILPKNVPAELLDFAVDRQFSIGVTYYSTALEYMDCVQEKIYLFWDK